MRKAKRNVAILMVYATLVGILPMTNPTVGKAVDVGYGINNPRTDGDGVTTWDCVWFGNYWQEDTNGDGEANEKDAKQPIKWRVLSVNGDDAFLLADKNLEVQWYNNRSEEITWETSLMRSWLNGYGASVNSDGKDFGKNNFLNNAFSKIHHFTTFSKKNNVQDNFRVIISLPKIHNKGK